jgi:indolepyruvate ferredoxin oxidoreductase
LAYVAGKEEVLVIEEKRGVIESQLKEYFYDWPGHKPQLMVGKHDEQGLPLLPWTGEMDPLLLVPVVAKRLDRFFPALDLPAKAAQLTAFQPLVLDVAGAKRTPYFCSGCPHNTSTNLPAGSTASLGIGCHVMAGWMGRGDHGFAQMGGEGVAWSVLSRYNGGQHRFQNMGEGTWYHSGSLAVRQAIAAKANITYKILYNDAVAMTGGQAVDGPISVYAIAHTSVAEGVTAIALVSDEPDKFSAQDLPQSISIHHRDELDTVQKRMRDTKGVTVIIYEQTCATEKRRRRKAGKLVDPLRFPVINHHVCEACGDCSVQSNCLSVEPRATALGRKRKVNSSSCNKDLSCLQGFCPSFVTVEGAALAKPTKQSFDYTAWDNKLAQPNMPMLAEPVNILVTGVGGTGVVTVGALLTMAAQLENKGASVLDFTGFAQKFGTVISYVRLASRPERLHQVRILAGGADAVIACDLVASSAPQASRYYRRGTQVVLNMAEMPTGDLVLHRDASLSADLRRECIGDAVGVDNLLTVDANELAERMLGNTVFANVIMLGYSWQTGALPVGLAALERAIELNGVAVEANRQAFILGRIMAVEPAALAAPSVAPISPASLRETVTRNKQLLTAYQDHTYAYKYESQLQDILPHTDLNEQQQMIIADTLRKFMAYKDEYEVARLYSQTDFADELQQRFEEGAKIVYHLAPPMLPLGKDSQGRPKKVACGSWMGKVFIALAKLKKLRGTPLDVFGYTRERRMERQLPHWFVSNLQRYINTDKLGIYLRLANDIRGFGPVKEQSIKEVKAKVAKL